MPKKKLKTLTFPFRAERDVLNESLEDFKSRLIGMPVFLLLNEHRDLCEQFGVQMMKSKTEWSETQSKIHERVSLVRKEILKIFHICHDQMMASEYYTDQAYTELEKKNKNVEVSKKSNKQSK